MTSGFLLRNSLDQNIDPTKKMAPFVTIQERSYFEKKWEASVEFSRFTGTPLHIIQPMRPKDGPLRWRMIFSVDYHHSSL